MKKRVTIEIGSYREKEKASSSYLYSLIMGSPNSFHFKITNKAISIYSTKNYKTKAAAISAAKSHRKMYKKLGMI